MAVTIERLIAEVEADPARAIASLREFEAATARAAQDRSARIRIDTDSAGVSMLAADLAEASNRANRASGSFDAFAGSIRGSGLAFMFLRGAVSGLALGGVIALASGAAGALQALGAAAAAAAASIGPLVGLLGAIPVGLGAVAGGLVATVLGLSGVSQGVKALDTASGGAAKSQKTLATSAREAAAAERGLEQAVRNVTRAQQDLKEATEAIAEARKQAAEDLRDQRLRVQEAVLNEASAVLRVKDAQEALARAQAGVGRSSVTLRREIDEFTGKTYEVAEVTAEATDSQDDAVRAALALKQAQLDLIRAQDDTRDSRRDLAEAERKGINGSDLVVDAIRRQQDALYALQAAQDAVKDAQDRLASAHAKQAGAAAGAAGGNAALAKAMDNLSPAGEAFVRFLRNRFLPAIKQLRFAAQEGLLPGIQKGLTAFMRTFPVLERRIFDFAKTMGDAFAGFMTHVASPEPLAMLDKVLKGLNETLQIITKGAKPFYDIVLAVTAAATPMTKMFAQDVVDALNSVAKKMKTVSGQRRLLKFFNEAYRWAGLWWDVLKPLARAIGGVVTAAKPLAEWILKELADKFEDLADAANSISGQKGLKDFFEGMKPALREMGGLISDLFGALFSVDAGGEDSALVKMLKELRESGVPALQELFQTLSESNFGPAIAELFGHLVDGLSAMAEHDGVFVVVVDGLNSLADALGALSDATDGKSTQVILGLLLGLGTFKVGRAVGGSINKNLILPIKKFGGVLGSTSKMWSKAKSAFETTALAAMYAKDWAKMALAATVHGAKIAAVWAKDIAKATAAGVAGFAKKAATFIKTWALIAAKALLHAARVAASWVIAMGPIGWAIAAVVGLGVIIYKNWDKIKKWTKDAWKKVSDWIGAAWDRIKKWTRDAWDWIKDKISKFLSWARSVFLNWTIVGLIVKHWDRIKTRTREVWDWIKDKIRNFTDWIKTHLSGTALRNTLSGMWDGLKTGFRNALNWVIDRWNNISWTLPTIDLGPLGKMGGQTIDFPNIPRLYKGGPVEKGEAVIVGENRPEVFVPTVSGRIQPKITEDLIGGGGITDAQMESMLRKIIAEMQRPNVEVEQVFNEKVDPQHMGKELVWRLR